MKSKIKVIIDIAITIGVVAMFYIGGNYITTLENQVYERDRLIDRLVFRDSLVKEYFNIEEDTINHITTYSLKDEKQNFQLIQGDSNVSVEAVVKDYNKLINKVSNIVKEHNDLVNKYYKVSESNYKLIEENRRLEKVLSMIKEHYDIEYSIQNNTDSITIRLIPSAKIDSALLLLPKYRDKLHYDASSGKWVVTYIVEKE